MDCVAVVAVAVVVVVVVVVVALFANAVRCDKEASMGETMGRHDDALRVTVVASSEGTVSGDIDTLALFLQTTVGDRSKFDSVGFFLEIDTVSLQQSLHLCC